MEENAHQPGDLDRAALLQFLDRRGLFTPTVVTIQIREWEWQTRLAIASCRRRQEPSRPEQLRASSSQPAEQIKGWGPAGW